MLNLVEKFTPAVEVETDDAGLTTVECAIAGALVAARWGPRSSTSARRRRPRSAKSSLSV